MKRGGQVLAGLLNDFSEVERAMTQMQTAAGAADAEMGIIEESLDFKINRLKETWVGAIQELIDRGDLGKLIDNLTELSEVLVSISEGIMSIAKTLGPAGSIISAGLIGSAFKGGFKDLITVIGSSKKAIDVAGKAVESFEDKVEDAGEVLDTTADVMKYLSDDAIETADAIGDVAESATDGSKSFTGLAGVLQKLSAITNLSAGAILGIGAAIAAVGIGISAYIAHQKELREEAARNADAFAEQNKSIDEQVETIEKLKKKLSDSNTSESEAYQVKNELYELQKHLNEQYGFEAERLDLVNGKYEEQIGLIREASREKAHEFVRENRSEYEKAKDTLAEESPYYISAASEKLIDYLRSQGWNLYADLADSGVYSINLSTEEAEKELGELYNQIEKFGKYTGEDVKATLDGIGAQSRKVTNDESIQQAKKIVDQQIEALVLEDEKLNPLYYEAKEAVEEYNKALANREGVEAAKENLDSVRKEVYGIKTDVAEAEGVFDDIFAGVNTASEKSYQINSAVDKAVESGDTKLQGYLDKLKSFDLDDIDLKKNLENLDSDAVQAFNSIMSYFGVTWDNADILIDKLVEIGVVGSDAAEKLSEIPKALTGDNFTKDISDLNDLETALNSLGTAMANASENGVYQLGDLDSIADYFLGLEDVPYDIEAVNNAIKLLGEGTGTIEENSEAIDTLADNYLRTSKIMDGLTEANQALYTARLKQMGITNAEEVVQSYLKPEIVIEENELKKQVSEAMDELSEGGHVQLNLTPAIDSKLLYETGEDAAAVFTKTFSNKTGNVAVNFTPIITDENGNYVSILDSDTLQRYAENVIAGVHDDYLNLQIGAQFEGEDAIEQAARQAEVIRQLQEAYYQYDGILQNVTESNAEQVEAELKAIGVANAHEIVIQSLSKQMEAEKYKYKEVVDAFLHGSAQEQDAALATSKALLDEANASDDARKAVFDLVAQQTIFSNQGLSVDAKISALEKLTEAYYGTAVAAQFASIAESNQKEFQAKAAALNTKNKGRPSSTYEFEVKKLREDYVSGNALKKQVEEAIKAASPTNTNYAGAHYDGGSVIKNKAGGGGGGGSKAADEAKEEKDALQELSSQLDEVQDAWKKLDSIQKDYAETGRITVDQAQELINIDYRYLAMLNLEGDAIAVNEAAFQSLAEAKLSEMKITLIRKAIDLVNTFVDEAKAAEYLTQSYFNLGAGAAQAAGELAVLYQTVANISGMGATQAQAANTVLQGTLNALQMLDHIDWSTAKGDDAKESAKEDTEEIKDEYEELFDYFERRVKVLQNAVEQLNAELENVNGSFAKNKLLDAQRGYNEQMLKDYSSALEMYQKMAGDALDKLPSEIADKARNGAVEITKFMGEANKEVVEAIKDYEGWADKVADCAHQIAELKEALRQLELQKFNNIVEEFSEKFDIRQNAIDLIGKQIDLFETAGQAVGRSFYEAQKNQTQKQLDLLREEKETLSRQLNEAMSNGVSAGTDEFTEMVSALKDVEGGMLDAQKAVEELDNALRQLEVGKFEKVAEQFASQFDMRQGAIDFINKQIELFEASGRMAGRSLYEEQRKQTEKQIDLLQKEKEALARQLEEAMANGVEAGSDEWIGMVNSLGQVETGILDAKKAVEELNASLRKLELDKFNKIAEQFDAQADIRQGTVDLISKQIDLYQTAGKIVGASFYAESRKQTERQIELLQKEKEALVRQMNEALNNGVTAGSEEWLSMVSTLRKVNGEILSCKKAVEEFDNSILNLHTEIFDRIQNVFSGFNDELTNLNSVLEDFDVSDENGAWSKEGLTRLGIAAQQYEMAKYQVKEYNEEIEELNRNYLEGKYSVTEYTDLLADLKSKQWDSVLASEAAKDAIVELNKARVDIEIEAINKETDAYSELIDQQKKELQAQKD